MKKINSILFGLHFFVGIGGMAGGFAAITNPDNPLGAPVEILKNSPFDDFLIPGILLFIVVGVGNVISALTLRANYRFQGYMSSVFSWGLVIWIIVQCIMLRAIAFLHILFFTIGLFMGILSTSILFKQKIFPVKLIIRLYNKFMKL